MRLGEPKGRGQVPARRADLTGLLPHARQRAWQLALQVSDELLAQLASKVIGVAGGARARDHPQLDRALMRLGHLQLDILAVPKRRCLHDLDSLRTDALDRRRMVDMQGHGANAAG